MLIETEPQMRSVFTYSQSRQVTRLPFPHVLCTICYYKHPTADQFGRIYQFGGIYGCGLRIFLRNSPLTKPTDEVFFSPTDRERAGLVCTPHQNDGKYFGSLDELVSFVISMWWNTHHRITPHVLPDGTNFTVDTWRLMTVEQILQNQWLTAGTWPQALTNSLRFGYGRNDVPIPEDAVLIDEPWPKAALQPQMAVVE